MLRPGFDGCGGLVWRALLGTALVGCGSARSSTLSTRDISDAVPTAAEECESTLEFVALGSLPEAVDSVWLALDPNSQRASWSYIGGQAARSFRWSNGHGISELPVAALDAMWKAVTVPSLRVSQSSADGRVGVGVNITSQGAAGFRWSEDGEAAQLEFVPGAVNRDGTVIVGVQRERDLARWTPTRGIEALGISQSPGQSILLSAAGDVIVSGDLDGHCHRWTESTGNQDLGLLPGMATCLPVLINEGGDVVVGTAQATPDSPMQLFRWTLAQGLQDLHVGDGPAVSAWPNSMNTDGSVIAATLSATDRSFNHLARWTEASGAQEIEPAVNSSAYYVAPRGDVIVGALDHAATARCVGLRGPRRPRVVLWRYRLRHARLESDRRDPILRIARVVRPARRAARSAAPGPPRMGHDADGDITRPVADLPRRARANSLLRENFVLERGPAWPGVGCPTDCCSMPRWRK